MPTEELGPLSAFAFGSLGAVAPFVTIFVFPALLELWQREEGALPPEKAIKGWKRIALAVPLCIVVLGLGGLLAIPARPEDIVEAMLAGAASEGVIAGVASSLERSRGSDS